MHSCDYNHSEDKDYRHMKDFDNHKQNNEAGDGVINSSGNPSSISAKLRAAVLGLTPGVIFKYTLFTSVIVVLAATIIYHTASQSIHVRIDKVETSSVVLSGSDNLGGIGSGEYKGVSYSLTNNSTAPSYVFVRIEESTNGLYEVVDTSGWCRLTTAENPGELIFAYGELGAMTPVPIGEEVILSGRLHCLASAEVYSSLSGDDMDIDVTGCLVYGTGGDYNTSAGALWQAYLERE